MAEFFFEYGLFFLKSLTIVISILAVVAVSIGASIRSKKTDQGQLEISKINEQFEHTQDLMQAATVDPETLKSSAKEKKKAQKEARKAQKKMLKKAAQNKDSENTEPAEDTPSCLFVLDFEGDMKASAVGNLRREISAVLSVAQQSDEVLVRIESGGGMVHAYGLAASQLQRIKNKSIPLTVCVDKVAASGGYMMACIADKLLAAPFAIIGSIGVVAQIPNFHRLLKKNDVDYEVITAGEYKRTLTILGENTDKGREKFAEEIEDVHSLFKAFVMEHRPQLDIGVVATGETWFGQRALEKLLVDSLMTSDEYIADACESRDVFVVRYTEKKTLPEKIGLAMQETIDMVLLKWIGRGACRDWFW